MLRPCWYLHYLLLLLRGHARALRRRRGAACARGVIASEIHR
jgi:hypothetical protein